VRHIISIFVTCDETDSVELKEISEKVQKAIKNYSNKGFAVEVREMKYEGKHCNTFFNIREDKHGGKD